VGSKNKLKRFKENENFKNVIQPTREALIQNQFDLKGNWCSKYFKNSNPIVVELGCGKGEYSINLAKKYPNKNFIGIDTKGARFWQGAKNAIIDEIPNVLFLRAQIELIEYIFSPGEISEIWITFPDPQIKFKRAKHRLTNQFFLMSYSRIIRKGGYIHLKTDSEFLHGYTLGLLEKMDAKIHYSHHDLYSNIYSPIESTEIKTYYEDLYLKKEKAITYIKFELCQKLI